MIPDFLERASKIDWGSLDTAYGPGDQVGRWLVDLTSPDPKTAFEATHWLWCSLCHQHAYVSRAAAPALPFLLEIAECADDLLLIELLDILWGFAICSRPPHSAWPTGGDWVIELRETLLARREWFDNLTHSANEDVADFAEKIIKCLKPVEAAVLPAD
jgi:hypothetical protein